MIVVASIHQPSTSTFNLFDKLLLLSGGQTHYFGSVDNVQHYYTELGHPMPNHTNPAEFILDLVNTDFSADETASRDLVNSLAVAWKDSSQYQIAHKQVLAVRPANEGQGPSLGRDHGRRKPNSFSIVISLLHRSFIKSYRDVVAYGIRIAMYTGLAIMMGTVWVRLSTDQSSIQPFTNAIVGTLGNYSALDPIPRYE